MFCCAGNQTVWDRAYHWDRPLYKLLNPLYENHFWEARLCMILPSAILGAIKVALWPLVATIQTLISPLLCCLGKRSCGETLLFAGSVVFWGGLLVASGFAIFHFGYPPTREMIAIGSIVGLRVIQQLGLGCAGEGGFHQMLDDMP